MDLSSYSLAQLRQLHSRISSAIRQRERGAKEVLLKKLTSLAKAEGFALTDILPVAAEPTNGGKSRKQDSGAAPSSKAKSPLPAKYAHPNDRTLSWSGRGRKPQWVEAWMSNGGALDALSRAAEVFATGKGRRIRGAEGANTNA